MRDIFLQLSKILQQETAWSWYCNTRDRVWGKLTSKQPYRVTWMTVCRCEGEGKGTGYTRLQQCDLWKLWGLGRTATITKFQNFDATSCYCKIGWNCLWISIFISTWYFCIFWMLCGPGMLSRQISSRDPGDHPLGVSGYFGLITYKSRYFFNIWLELPVI